MKPDCFTFLTSADIMCYFSHVTRLGPLITGCRRHILTAQRLRCSGGPWLLVTPAFVGEEPCVDCGWRSKSRPTEWECPASSCRRYTPTSPADIQWHWVRAKHTLGTLVVSSCNHQRADLGEDSQIPLRWSWTEHRRQHVELWVARRLIYPITKVTAACRRVSWRQN